MDESVVRPLIRATIDRVEGVHKAKAAARQCRRDVHRGAWPAITNDVVDDAAELRSESKRRGAPHDVNALDRFRRRRIVGLWISEEVRGNAHTVLSYVHFNRLRGVEPAKANAIGRESCAFRLGEMRSRNSAEDLSLDILRDICAQGVHHDDLALLARIDHRACYRRQMANDVQLSACGDDDFRKNRRRARGVPLLCGCAACNPECSQDKNGGATCEFHGSWISW